LRLVVADASALIEYLLGPEKAGAIADTIESPEADVHVPALCDVEVAAGLRRALRLGLLSECRAREALGDYADLPLSRHGHLGILNRLLELRENFSAYDAAYAALAEALGAVLLTADARLARAARDQLGLPIEPG
jgi:predicted nucleic acid-binding protein